MHIIKRVINALSIIDIHDHGAIKNIRNIRVDSNPSCDDFDEPEDLVPYMSDSEIKLCLQTKNDEYINSVLKSKLRECKGDNKVKSEFVRYFCNLVFYTDLYPKSGKLLSNAGFDLTWRG